MKTAVIIGRFQVPSLHPAHMAIIQKAVDLATEHIIIMIGTTGMNPTDSDPLSYEDRVAMIDDVIDTLDVQVEVSVIPLKDIPFSNVKWSEAVDKRVSSLSGADAQFIVGRDSFMPHYKGEYLAIEVDAVGDYSGESIRRNMVVRHTSEYRKGKIIAQTEKPYANIYPTVDALVHRKLEGKGIELLLGKKHGEETWRMPGGFLDVNDASMEVACAREVREECGDLEIGVPQYFMSCKVNDRRYAKSKDTVYTTVFTVPYVYGTAIAGDDLEIVAWHTLADIREGMVPLLDGHKHVIECYAE